MIRKLVIIAGLILFLVVFVSLTRQIVTVWQASYRLDQATEEVANLQKQNQQLKDKLKQVTSIGFIEQQARDKLNMARPGETVVIIGQDQINQVASASAVLGDYVQIPNWQAWLNLFFH